MRTPPGPVEYCGGRTVAALRGDGTFPAHWGAPPEYRGGPSRFADERADWIREHIVADEITRRAARLAELEARGAALL